MALITIERKGQLYVHWLLDPEHAVVVEGRDTLIDRHEVRPALLAAAVGAAVDGGVGLRWVRQRLGTFRYYGGACGYCPDPPCY